MLVVTLRLPFVLTLGTGLCPSSPRKWGELPCPVLRAPSLICFGQRLRADERQAGLEVSLGDKSPASLPLPRRARPERPERHEDRQGPTCGDKPGPAEPRQDQPVPAQPAYA